jgi:hypothetical protein
MSGRPQNGLHARLAGGILLIFAVFSILYRPPVSPWLSEEPVAIAENQLVKQMGEVTCNRQSVLTHCRQAIWIHGYVRNLKLAVYNIFWLKWKNEKANS